MLKEAMEFLMSKAVPNKIEHGGITYVDKQMTPLNVARKISPMEIATLSGLAGYIKSGVDEGCYSTLLVVCIERHDAIYVYEYLNQDGDRPSRLVVKPETPKLTLDRFMPLEEMNIMLQSCFIQTPDRDIALTVIGNITDGQVNSFSDDGVSQQVTVKAGVQRVGLEKVPNPVFLRPYRTFIEVQQPASPFVLRLRSGQGDAPTAGLFTADGGMWMIQARRDIEAYLREALQQEIEDGEVTILA